MGKAGGVGSMVDDTDVPGVDRTHSSVPEAPAAKPRPRHRKPGARFVGLLRRLWIPLVIVAVVAAGGFTVSRLRGVFGSEQFIPYGDVRADETKPVDPSYLTYEITGPAGTTAQISYFDANGDPQFLDAVSLPWSLEFPMNSAVAVGSIAAQGDSGSISCRILIDDVVKASKTTNHEASAFTSCLLSAS